MTINNVRSELLISQIKHIDSLFSELGRTKVSPLEGFNALNQGQLRNLRFYGNYGKSIEDVPCDSRFTSNENDCPRDYVAALLQRLFPSRDLENFVPNQLPNHIDFIFGHFKEKEVALVIKAINKAGPKTSEGEWIHELSIELLKSMYSLDEDRSLDKILEEINLVGSGKYTDLNSKECFDLSELASRPKIGKKNMNKIMAIQDFVTMIWKSLKSESLANHNLYPPNITKKILLGFLIKTTTDKKHYINDFLRNFPKSYFTKNTFPPSGNDNEHQSSEYDQSIYTEWKKSIIKEIKKSSNTVPSKSLKQLLKEIKNKPELAAFIGTGTIIFDRQLPSKIDFSNAHHPSIKDATYPDCGESALRNLFDGRSYDRRNKILSPDFWFEKARELNLDLPERNINPDSKSGLIGFYKKFPDLIQRNSQEARDFWSMYVVADWELSEPTKDKNHVRFLKPNSSPKCEIDAGIINFFEALNRILGDNHGEDSLGSILKKVRSNPSISNLTNLLNRWSIIFSTEDEKWTWEGDLTNEKDTTLLFSINGKEKFKIRFTAHHFSYENLESIASPIHQLVENNYIDSKNPLYGFGLSPNTYLNTLNHQKKNADHWLWNLDLTFKNKLQLLLDPNFELPRDLFLRWAQFAPNNDLDSYLAILESVQKYTGDERDNLLTNLKHITKYLLENSDASLHEALRQNFPHALEYILKNIKPDGRNPKNVNGHRLLREATAKNDQKIVKLIIDLTPKKFLHISKLEGDGQSALHVAASLDSSDILSQLYQLRSNDEVINPKNSFDQTLLHESAANNRSQSLDFILKQGINSSEINVVNNVGMTPLQSAISSNSKDTFNILWKKIQISTDKEMILGPNPEWTNLHYAAESGNFAIFKTLLEETIKNKLPFNPKGRNNITPLHVAAANGQAKIVNLILDHLLESGDSLHPVDLNKTTPLHDAVRKNREEVAKIILERCGPIPSAKERDGFGKTPLDYATNNRNINLKLLLFSHETIETPIRKNPLGPK